MVKSIEGGIGGTLGHIAPIIGLDVMRGRLIAIPSVLQAGQGFALLSRQIAPSAYEKISHGAIDSDKALPDINKAPAFGGADAGSHLDLAHRLPKLSITTL